MDARVPPRAGLGSGSSSISLYKAYNVKEKFKTVEQCRQATRACQKFIIKL